MIDGNNILVTNKKLRKLFKEKDEKFKAEAQIRLTWLMCTAYKLTGFYLFFDEYYEKVDYDLIKK
jgi:hypothetical protein